MATNRFHTLTLVTLLILLILPKVSLSAKFQEIVDDEGNITRFDKPFSRIISLYPAHTENLAFLGCDREVIGVSRADNFPATFADKARFSYRDNAEKFLAAKPDLILIRPMISRAVPGLITKLRSTGITIISVQPTSISQMLDYWRTLGLLTGKSTEAEAMVRDFSHKVESLNTRVASAGGDRPRVYFESIHSKMKTFAPSAISMFALKVGGGKNIATDAVGRNNSNIAPYGKERILSRAREIDVFLSQVGRMNRISITDIYNEPGFQLIKALQTKSVFLVEEEFVSRPTMRLLIGIRQIQEALYPELRKEQPDVVRHVPFTSQAQLQKWQ